jgi:hypothetical protein
MKKGYIEILSALFKDQRTRIYPFSHNRKGDDQRDGFSQAIRSRTRKALVGANDILFNQRIINTAPEKSVGLLVDDALPDVRFNQGLSIVENR